VKLSRASSRGTLAARARARSLARAPLRRTSVIDIPAIHSGEGTAKWIAGRDIAAHRVGEKRLTEVASPRRRWKMKASNEGDETFLRTFLSRLQIRRELRATRLDAPMPRRPDAPMPRCPDAPMPRGARSGADSPMGHPSPATCTKWPSSSIAKRCTGLANAAPRETPRSREPIYITRI